MYTTFTIIILVLSLALRSKLWGNWKQTCQLA